METTNQKSLYDRLGGAQGISNIVDDIVENHMNNPAVKNRYILMAEDPDRKERIKKHVRDFLGAGSGGPEEYTGMDMPTTHRGMNISPAEFIEVLDDILKALDKNNIEPNARNEVLAISYSLKDQIVGL
jgi:hemoglobin